MFVCLYAPAWPEPASSPLPAELLAIAPRITMATEVVWADVSGLPVEETAAALLAHVAACGGGGARAGVAVVPIVAELAARAAAADTVTIVSGDERSFIAPLPLTFFANHEHLLELLAGVGVRTCGELAALEREAVEVRFGVEAVELWQWSRAQDERRVFGRTAPEQLHAATDFIDYVVTDPERLIFVANALFASVCDQLRAHGEHARRVLLTLSLANRTSWQRTIRPSRPTASRVVWLRLTRALFERLTVPDAVTGVQIEVIATEPATAVQGDLFDAGFATAAAVESAVARLLEVQRNVIKQPETNQHPLAEERNVWTEAESPSLPVPQFPSPPVPRSPGLELRLLAQPREVLVESIRRRDHVLPIRYRDGQWKQLVTAAGPDRISGGKWDDAYAREYFRGVTVDGQLVWLFRDAKSDRWFLHGYWD